MAVSDQPEAILLNARSSLRKLGSARAQDLRVMPEEVLQQLRHELLAVADVIDGELERRGNATIDTA